MNNTLSARGMRPTSKNAVATFPTALEGSTTNKTYVPECVRDDCASLQERRDATMVSLKCQNLRLVSNQQFRNQRNSDGANGTNVIGRFK